jgi:hypothetical protein
MSLRSEAETEAEKRWPLAWIGRKPKQHTITGQPPSVTEKPRFGSRNP